MYLKKIAMALIVAAGLSINVASAAETYIGIGFGKSDVKNWLAEEDVNTIFIENTGLPLSTGHAETSDSAMKIYLGIATSENIDIRFGYANLGEATVKAENFALSLNGNAENRGVFVDLLAKFKPDNRLALYGKLGLAFMKTELTVSGSGTGGFAQESLQSDSLVFSPGVGISLDITDKIGLAAEYERYLSVGDEEETGQSDIDVFSANLFVRF